MERESTVLGFKQGEIIFLDRLQENINQFGRITFNPGECDRIVSTIGPESSVEWPSRRSHNVHKRLWPQAKWRERERRECRGCAPPASRAERHPAKALRPSLYLAMFDQSRGVQGWPSERDRAYCDASRPALHEEQARLKKYNNSQSRGPARRKHRFERRRLPDWPELAGAATGSESPVRNRKARSDADHPEGSETRSSQPQGLVTFIRRVKPSPSGALSRIST